MAKGNIIADAGSISLGSDRKDTRCVAFNHLIAGTLAFIADRDYHIQEVAAEDSSTGCLSLDGTTESVAVGTTKVLTELVWLRHPARNMNFPLKTGTTLYCNRNTAGQVQVILAIDV